VRWIGAAKEAAVLHWKIKSALVVAVLTVVASFGGGLFGDLIRNILCGFYW
jgi:hypothetical protein